MSLTVTQKFGHTFFIITAFMLEYWKLSNHEIAKSESVGMMYGKNPFN